MSLFSVANTYNLRTNYGTYHAYSTAKGRENESSVSKLNYVDSIALRRAVRRLADFDFEEYPNFVFDREQVENEKNGKSCETELESESF